MKANTQVSAYAYYCQYKQVHRHVFKQACIVHTCGFLQYKGDSKCLQVLDVRLVVGNTTLASVLLDLFVAQPLLSIFHPIENEPVCVLLYAHVHLIIMKHHTQASRRKGLDVQLSMGARCTCVGLTCAPVRRSQDSRGNPPLSLTGDHPPPTPPPPTHRYW